MLTWAYLREEVHDWLIAAGRSPEYVHLTPLMDEWFVTGDGFVGYDRFREMRAAATLAPYGRELGCGGSLILAAIGGDEVRDVNLSLISEIVMERPPERLPSHDGTIEGDGFTIDIPSEWEAATRPPGGTGLSLSATRCDDPDVGGASVYLSLDQGTNSITASDGHDQLIGEITADPAHYQSFTIDSRSAVSVPGARDADLLVYSYRPPGQDPIQYWDLIASDGVTVTRLIVSTPVSSRATFETDIVETIRTLRLD
jgi:hypothetical protein